MIFLLMCCPTVLMIELANCPLFAMRDSVQSSTQFSVGDSSTLSEEMLVLMGEVRAVELLSHRKQNAAQQSQPACK